MKKILIGTSVLLISLSIGVFYTFFLFKDSCFYKPIDKQKEAECINQGGEYKMYGGPIDSKGCYTIDSYYCLINYTDGGKKCTTSKDCQGSCMVTKDTNIKIIDIYKRKYIGGFGKCADKSTDADNGGTIENPMRFTI